MGSTFTTNITGSTVGAFAQGDHATASGTVNLHQGPLTQAQHLEHIARTAKKALADDEDRLEAMFYEALEKFLKQARVVQVAEKPNRRGPDRDGGDPGPGLGERSGKAVPQGLRVTQALAREPGDGRGGEEAAGRVTAA